MVREIGSVTYQGFADRLTGRGEVRAVYELWSPVEVILEPVCVCVIYCPHAVAAKRVVLTVRRTDAGRDVARLSQLASSP